MTAVRHALTMIAQRRFWTLALVPALTLGAVTPGLPLWALGLLILAQVALLWAAWRDAGDAGAYRHPQGHVRQYNRADLLRLLRQQGRGGMESGGGAAALAIRLDGADHLRHVLGPARHAALLEALCQRLEQALRDQDRFCALEADGFGVALHAQRNLDLGAVLAVAQRIQARLAAPLPVDGVTLWPSVSVGFCLSPRAAMLNGLDMLQAAEIGADKALRSGPGGLTSYSVVDFPASITGDRIATLRHALDSGQIRPHFQPQIRTDTGAISGLEALARWHHPQNGVVSPGDFLPLIEAAGLSPRLATLMLRESLTVLRHLDTLGLKVPKVSVNLSAEELRQPRFADEIAWELDRQELTPDRLTLEILETVVARSDDDDAVRTIARLATLGCGIDLDDFGTGHASIATIRSFAISRIKIDRSFVTNLHTSPEQRRIVAAILSMAQQLGLGTLAEGVEHPEEQVRLAQMGCGHLQGFAIARPMPPADLPAWLRGHAAALDAGEPWVEDLTRAAASNRTAAE